MADRPPVEPAPGLGGPPRGAGVLAAGALVAFLVVLSTRPPAGSEVRYVLAAREMAEDGDWVVPHLGHVPYMEKPILLYWAAAGARLLAGASNVAIRLPSILAGVGTLAVTYAFARQLRGRVFALAASAILGTSLLFAFASSVLLTDGLFAAWLAVAWLALWRHREDPGGRWIWAFWGAVGLAVLTKGLLALGFVGVSTGTYLLLSRRLRDVRRMRPLAGPALVVAMQLPWTLLVLERDPRLVEFYYLRENLGAFVAADVNHDRSPLAYLPWLVAVVFPWSALLVATLLSALVGLGREVARRFAAHDPAPAGSADDLRVYLASIVVPSFLLLSAAASKLATYLLPILPAAVLLAADRVAALVASWDLRFRRAFFVQGALLAAGAATAPLLLAGIPPEKLWGAGPALVPAVVAGTGVLAAGSFAAWRLLLRGRVVPAFASVGGSAVAVVVAASLAVPRLLPDLDGSGLARRMEALRAPVETVVVSSRIAHDLTVFLPLRDRAAFLGTPGELGMGHFVECTGPEAAIPRDPNRVDRATCPGNPWLLDDETFLARWDGIARVWFVARPEDLGVLREAGRSFHVLGGDTRRTIVTNLPLAAAR